jgi:hypothetical protein
LNPKAWPNLRPGDLLEISASCAFSGGGSGGSSVPTASIVTTASNNTNTSISNTGLNNTTIASSSSSSSTTTQMNSNQLNHSLNRGAFANGNHQNTNTTSMTGPITTNSSSSLHLSQSTHSFAPLLTNGEDETSPFLLLVTQASFSDAVAIDAIRIDQAATNAPFSIKNLSYANVTVVDKSVLVLCFVLVNIFKNEN